MLDKRLEGVRNEPAPGIGYFSPYQNPKAGTAADPQSDGTKPPKLFQPLKLRGLTLQNRIGLSPLCQYSADDGHITDWHMAHLGGISLRGPGFILMEATAVLPEGRISPEDAGLWKDSQIEPLRRLTEFIHSQNQVIGIQLAHAGRKASTLAPFLATGDIAVEAAGGWPDNIKGPSDIPYSARLGQPKAMAKADIEEVKQAWGASVRRAVAAGMDFIEIHNAHGYLLYSFLSPVSNNRTDEYGGSFENRMRLTNEIVDICRQNMPEDMPLFLRFSASDWLEESRPDLPSWKLEDSIRFSQVLAEKGQVDFLDVSSGGNHPDQRIALGPSFQAHFAIAIKKTVGDRIAVGTVGGITNGNQANDLLEKDGLDSVLIGRLFMKNPAAVWTFAEDLGVDFKIANQIGWAFATRGSTGFLKLKGKVHKI
ncbi:NADH-dependent flavin oxidoreductase [Ophidiomyces ophidiicola]|uniref:NADH-dependent flavin oxidoreductase n=1 Tax=Ophidiomyces ophidiicola TaxID=1387563 RepID=A0ACB8V3N5_9EURO|nr:NADH-dependent flavin oxidoreductase [Ophidiomyces ophidiicola]KAI1912677.1 NADH-dependent flavin oxidoreductase [Ophidiomyces ophidiicola]KAI1918147.1 NADH-dependent flavin oxidoreductase [Ophidiomyces ophidiicola]KAI1928170.1 NADH-dependent flavin oxidoreductase [Ophidiomyces ophidiicola]KAI1939661.1 NADH-dependent flavin oxidoreductase [Ophidiomyces ophidiicola]KAI1954633.1 NADH-dependent flavin oxidoreductase [Ophidiomyces ophidiicola]